jgi:hypothetical protein
MKQATTIPFLPFRTIADSTTIVPGSTDPFLYFAQPTYNGDYVVFYGNNMTYEGIYFVDTDGNLTKVSDNFTVIQELGSVPTDGQGGIPDAYTQSASAAPIAPCSNDLIYPMPVQAENGVVFSAANWQTGKAGIFYYDTAAGTTSVVADNLTGTFSSGQFSQALYASRYFYFTAVQNNNAHPGVYYQHILSGSTGMIIDISTATTPSGQTLQSISNSQLQPLVPLVGQDTDLGILYFYGMLQNGNDGIFSYGANGLQILMTAGLVIDTYTVTSIYYTGVSQCGNLLTFMASLNNSDQEPATGLMVMEQTETGSWNSSIVATDLSLIPYINQFDSFPPVTDGTRVAYVASYSEGDKGYTAIFVWNKNTQQITIALSTANEFEGSIPQAFFLTKNSFHDGKLAVAVSFGLNYVTYGVYLLDLSGF